MKRIILIVVILFAGFNQKSQAQCSSSGSFGFLTSAQTICGNDVFSRRIYIEDDGSGTWDIVTTAIEVEIDWGDGTAPILYNIPYNGGLGAWTDLATHTAPDGAAHTACTYEATAVLYVDGADCSVILGGGAIQTLDIIIWDEVDNANLGTHDTDLSPNTATGGINGNTIEVCEGDTQDVVIMDNSDFNCSTVEPDPLNRNVPRRWIQFVYGTGGSNITGVVLIDGNPDTLPYFGDVQLVPFGAPVATNEDALSINFPATAIAGEIFEVTLRSWNVCNPYDDFATNGELNPIGGVYNVGNAFADAAEAPIEITQLIEIIDKPNSPTPNNELICQTDVVPDLTVIPAAGATSIIWYDGDPTLGAVNVLQNSGSATYATGVSSVVANQYSYWVTQINAGDNNCESDPVEVTLTVREQLSIDPIDFDSDPGAIDVCTGITGLMFSVPDAPAVETYGGVTEYEWEIIGGGISIIGATNGQSITIDIASGTTGNRTIRLWRRYVGAPLCPEYVTYDIDVFPTTVPGNLNGGVAICENSSTPLLELTGYTGSVLRWERSYNAGAFVTIGNAGLDTFSEILTIDGSYEYRVVVQSGGGCAIEYSTTTTVNVFDVPPAPTAGTNQNLCGLLTYTLGGSSPGVYTGLWTVVTNPSGTPPVFSDATSETSDVSILAGDEGVYEFEWTVTNGPCSTSEIVEVNFREAPTVTNAGANDVVCGTSYTLSGNAIVVGVGTWSVIGFPAGGGLAIDDVNDPISNVTLNVPLTYGVYTLQWESINGIATCNSNSTVDVTFNQGAESYAGLDLERCMTITAPTNVNLSGTIGGISTSGRWEVISGNGVLQSSGAANGVTVGGVPTFTLNDVYIPDFTDIATIVELRLRADSPNASCPDEYSTIQITINEEIVVDAATNGTFNTPTEICQSAGSLSAFAIYGLLSGGRLGTTGVATLSGHWEVVSGAGTILNGTSINGNVINDGYTPGVADLGTTVILQLVGDDPDGGGLCSQMTNQFDIFINEEIMADAATDGVNITPNAVCVNASLTSFDVYGLLTGGVLGATSATVHNGHWEVITGNGVMNSSSTSTGNSINASVVVDQYVPATTDLGTTITLRLIADDPDVAGPCGDGFDEINIEINEELIVDASTNGVDVTSSVICVNPVVLSSFDVYGAISGGKLGNSGVAVRNGHWEIITGNGTMTSTNASIGSSITGSIINDGYSPIAADLGTTIELHLVAEDNDIGGPCGDVIDAIFIEINELLVADATTNGTDFTPTAVCIDATNIIAFSVYGVINGGRLGANGSASLNGHWEVVTGNGEMTSSSNSVGNTISSSNSIIDAYLPNMSDIGTTVRLRLVGEDPDAGGPCVSHSSEINIQINEEGFVTANQSVIQIAEGTTVIGGGGVDQLGAIISGSGSSGQWSVVSVPNEGVISDVNSLTPNFTPSVNQEIIGSVTLQFDMDDTDGGGPCTGKSVQVVINIAQNPTADAGALSDICEDEIVNLNGTIGGSAVIGTWTVSGGNGVLSTSIVAGNIVSANYTPDVADVGNTITFSLTTDDPDGGGPVLADSDDVSLTVNPLPVIAGVSGALETCVGSAAIPYFVQGANPAFSVFNWDLSSLGIDGVDYELTAGGNPLHFVIIKYLVPQTNRSISVTETITTTGCDASYNVTGINIYDYPSVLLESSDDDFAICEGEEVAFTANPVSGIDASTNYEFMIDGLTVQNGLSNTYTTTGLQTGNGVTVRVSNGGTLCDITEGPIVHVVSAKPDAFNQSVVICSNISGMQQATVNLTLLETAIDGGGGSSITWYDNAALLAPSITAPSNYTVLNGAILYAEVDAGVGCTNVAQIEYAVNPSPAITAAVTSDYISYGVSCFGANDGQITTSLIANGTAPYLYSINGGITFQASNIFDNLEAGNYSIIIQDDNECTYASPNVAIIDPLPVSAGLISGGGIVCEGDDLTEIEQLSSAFGGIGGYSYQWQYSYDQNTWATISGAVENTYLPNVDLLQESTYFRRGITTGTCDEQFSNTVELKINALPTGMFDFLSIDGTSVITEVCENQPFMIQFQFTGAEPFFFDYTDGLNDFENQFGAATMLVPISGGISDDLTVDLTNVRGLNGCETALAISKTLNVIKINSDFTVLPQVSCSGADVEFSFKVDVDIEYTFNFGDGNSFFIPANTLALGENMVVHNYVNGSPSTTFSFNSFLVAEKVNGTHCGPVQHFETVTIYPSVLPNVFTPTSEICSGELISFDNQTLGATNHEWYYRTQGVDEQIDFQTTKQADFTIINNGENNPQVYEIIYRGYTDNNDGNVCESTQIIPVNVYKYAEPDFNYTPINPVILNGATSVVITNTSNPIDNSNFQYNWEFGDGLTATDVVYPDNVSYSQAGDKEVKLTVMNRMNISCSRSIYKTISIEDIPIAADFIIEPSEGCTPLLVEVNNNTLGSANQFTWTIFKRNSEVVYESIQLSEAGQPAPVSFNYTLYDPGSYSVQLIAENTYTGQKDVVYRENALEVFPIPTAAFELRPYIIYLPDQQLQTFNYTNLNDANVWYWNFGDGIGTSTDFEPEYLYEEVGQYMVTLVAGLEHENGIACYDTLSLEVSVEEGGLTQIPNAFTPSQYGPSGSGRVQNEVDNDIFLPITEGVIDDGFHMMIFDRWGNLLFESRDKEIGWDGFAHDGKALPAGVYVYKLSLTMKTGRREDIIGDINLIR